MIRRPDLLIRESAGETFLYDRASGRAHWLNSTASVIWDLIDDAASKADLARSVAALFALEPDEARSGVDAVVDELAAQGLLGEAREPLSPPGGAGPGANESDVALEGPRFLGVPPNL